MSSQLFPELSTQVETPTDEQTLNEIESYCVRCGENGMTRMLLVNIPFFREVVIMSFKCPHCGESNNDLQSAQTIAEKGIRFVVKCESEKDLSRQIIKTEWAEIEIPEIEFEVKKQGGSITNIEGVIDRAIEGLRETQKELTERNDTQSASKLSDFLLKLCAIKTGTEKFTFILNDISGNSYVENLCTPASDPCIEVKHYTRSREEDKLLSIYEIEGDNKESNTANPTQSNKLSTLTEEEDIDDWKKLEANNEVLEFTTNCSNCNAPCFTNMKVINIPHFKDVVVMATTCDACGHKTNEIKSGAGIEEKGVRLTLKVDNESDLKRDVVKSDTCSVCIPDVDISVDSSGSGKYTTVEGVVETLKDQLRQVNPFLDGDSAKSEVRDKVERLLEKLDNLIGFTVILDDPCGNSYIDGVKGELYERSWQQNEELGLNDIKTEGYQS